MLKTDKQPSHAPVAPHHQTTPYQPLPYTGEWQALAPLYQTEAMRIVADCLLAGAEVGLNGYIKCAADYGLRGLIDTDAQAANMARQVGTSNAESMRAVFTALVESHLQHSMLATFTGAASKSGKDKRQGVSPEALANMTRYARQHMATPFGGLPEATWVSFVVTSVASLCWQVLAQYGDSGAVDTSPFAQYQEEMSRRDVDARLEAFRWHRLQDSQPTIRNMHQHKHYRKRR